MSTYCEWGPGKTWERMGPKRYAWKYVRESKSELTLYMKTSTRYCVQHDYAALVTTKTTRMWRTYEQYVSAYGNVHILGGQSVKDGVLFDLSE